MNNKMQIEGARGNYIVGWEAEGWSYAVCYVYERKKIWFLPISRLIKVHRGMQGSLLQFEQLKPNKLIKLYNQTVYSYEGYLEAWNKHETNLSCHLND